MDAPPPPPPEMRASMLETKRATFEEADNSSCNWYFPRKVIDNDSPSRKDGIDLRKEQWLRRTVCTFCQELGMRLKVPQLTIATAIAFCHRFFLRQSHAKNDRFVVATTCMFLAGKVEETPRPLATVITVAYEIRNKKDPSAAKRIKDDKALFEREKELILMGERLVLNTLGFDLNINHPYKPLLTAIKKFLGVGGESSQLAQVAWNFVNDGLRTSLMLQFKPHHIAAGAIFLAAKFLKITLPTADGNQWWTQFGVNPTTLEEVSSQMLELYEQASDKPSASRGSGDRSSRGRSKAVIMANASAHKKGHPPTPALADRPAPVRTPSEGDVTQGGRQPAHPPLPPARKTPPLPSHPQLHEPQAATAPAGVAEEIARPPPPPPPPHVEKAEQPTAKSPARSPAPQAKSTKSPAALSPLPSVVENGNRKAEKSVQLSPVLDTEPQVVKHASSSLDDAEVKRLRREKARALLKPKGDPDGTDGRPAKLENGELHMCQEGKGHHGNGVLEGASKPEDQVDAEHEAKADAAAAVRPQVKGEGKREGPSKPEAMDATEEGEIESPTVEVGTLRSSGEPPAPAVSDGLAMLSAEYAPKEEGEAEEGEFPGSPGQASRRASAAYSPAKRSEGAQRDHERKQSPVRSPGKRSEDGHGDHERKRDRGRDEHDRPYKDRSREKSRERKHQHHESSSRHHHSSRHRHEDDDLRHWHEGSDSHRHRSRGEEAEYDRYSKKPRQD